MNAWEFKLCALIQRYQAGPAVLPEYRLIADLGLDSLDLVELGLAIEDEFGVILEADQVKNCKTVQDLAEKISQEIAELRERKALLASIQHHEN